MLNIKKQQSIVGVALIIALVALVFITVGDDLIMGAEENFMRSIKPTNRIGKYDSEFNNDLLDKLEAKISGPTEIKVGETATFSDVSTSTGACIDYIRSYPWGSSSEYEKAFDSTGRQTITLRISGCNQTSTANFTVDVVEDDPEPIDFLIDPEKTPIDNETTVNIVGGHLTEDIIEDYEWKLNGSIVNWDNETSKVFSVGTHTISYRGKRLGYSKWSDWKTKSITIIRSNEAPFASGITKSGAETIDQNITFTSKAGDADGDNLNAVWEMYNSSNSKIKTFNNSGSNISDGSYSEKFQMNYTFTTPGTYTVKITISDGNGGSITKSISINIADYVPYSKNYASVGQHTWTVPYTGTYEIKLYGAEGGGPHGGSGGYIKGEIDLSQNDKLNIFVGGAGSQQNGGWNGGGDIYTGNDYGGGGATDIRKNGTSLYNRILVAGGGGGAYTSGGIGGDGGGFIGVDGKSSPFTFTYSAATGGTQNSGGLKGEGRSFNKQTNGTLGQGGKGFGNWGGGGGGGYFGGGGGLHWGGGGGSSYYDPSIISNAQTSSGINNGNGKAYIKRLNQ